MEQLFLFWGVASIKLIFKSGDLSDPLNFRPIALTSVVWKLLHKILSRQLETYLKASDVLDTSVQKGLLVGYLEFLSTSAVCLQPCRVLSLTVALL